MAPTTLEAGIAELGPPAQGALPLGMPSGIRVTPLPATPLVVQRVFRSLAEHGRDPFFPLRAPSGSTPWADEERSPDATLLAVLAEWNSPGFVDTPESARMREE